MIDRQMTPEELLERLKAEGIDLNRWVKVEENYVKPVAVEEQQKLLVQLKGFLEGIVEQDRQKVLQLKEQIARMQHGGGV